MPRTEKAEALILKTYDVGEADRYCILFTRELGRLAARATGVRKPKSRMGGSLLPFRAARVELKQGSAGWIIAAAEGSQATGPRNLAAFAAASEGVELLLRLVQDGEPLREVFDSTMLFLDVCGKDNRCSLAYALRLLHLLGYLPEGEELDDVVGVWHAKPLRQDERDFINAARAGRLRDLPPLTHADTVERLRDRLLHDQLTSPLKAPRVSAEMTNHQ